MAAPWLLFSYRLPSRPTRLRLAAWRRLKRVGAILVHDSIWILPAGPAEREAFDWVAESIEEWKGTALLWEAASLPAGQDAELVARFRAATVERYHEIEAAAIRLGRLGARRRVTGAQIEQGLQRLRTLERALVAERRRDRFSAGADTAAAALTTAFAALRSRQPGPRR